MNVTSLILLALVAVVTPALGARLPYIIGGTTVTDETRYPWQGSLQFFGSHSCGCALISDTWVVTAAHCVGSSESFYKLRFGVLDRRNVGQDRPAKKIIAHENFGSGSGSFPNDVAVISFDIKVDFNSKVAKIAIAKSDQSGNADCWITGWGLTSTGGVGSLPTDLQEANIIVYTNTACKLKWGSSINDGHVCVGNSDLGRGACNGDSGGPLVCRVNGFHQLVGVTSWGVNGCRTNYYPSVYTRLSYFKSWITGKTGVQ